MQRQQRRTDSGKSFNAEVAEENAKVAKENRQRQIEGFFAFGSE
jgi:hypothetical protein